MHRLFALIAVLILASAASAQPVRYVDADAAPGGDGTSWATAFDDFQDALAVVTAGDEVWVAEGLYRPGDGTGQTGGRDAAFVLVDGAGVYGGFDGTETERDERDPEAHVTVLSGDLDGDGTYAQNAYHVVVASNTSASTVLDGFTITAGSADGTVPRNRGGGLYGVWASLTVRQCMIEQNRAVQTDGEGGGAGVFVGGAGSSPRFEWVQFLDNDGSSALGGGLWLLEGGHATLSDVRFEGNRAQSGAGALVWDFRLDLARAEFVCNRAYRGGGGIYLVLNSEAIATDVMFYGNEARPEGSGLLGGGGGLYLLSGSTLLLSNAVFVGNEALKGGGASFGGSDATLTNVAFVANVADEEGGAMRPVAGTDIHLDNAVVWSNEAPLGPVAFVGGADLSIEQGLIEGGCPAPGPGGSVNCQGVLDADPLFTRAPDPGPDATWGTPDDDYGDLHLLPGSPALDHGLAALLPPDLLDLDDDGDTSEPLPLDLDGAPRIQGDDVDLGPYERPVQVVMLEAAPIDGPVVIPPGGGTFSFRVRLTNLTNEPQTVSGGTAATLPNGTLYGPILERAGVTVPAGATVVATFRQRVPGWAPSGSYGYVVYTGSYPAFAQTATFPLVKEAGAPVAAGSWTVETVEPFAVEVPVAARAEAVAEGAVLSVGAVYPNPARGRVAVPVALASPAFVELAVYDALGRRVAGVTAERLEAGSHAVPLAVGGLPSGVYLVRVTAEGEAVTRRLVVAD